jgi:hypothetical protein
LTIVTKAGKSGEYFALAAIAVLVSLGTALSHSKEQYSTLEVA